MSAVDYTVKDIVDFTNSISIDITSFNLSKILANGDTAKSRRFAA